MIPPGRVRSARGALGAVGAGLGLWGLWLLLDTLSPSQWIRLPLWLGGAVVVDDLVLVPALVVGGWVLTRWSLGPLGRRIVPTVRTTLLYVALTSLIALPLVLRQGKGANPTVLPRDYLRDWLVLEAAIVGVAAVVVLVQRLVRARRQVSA